METGHTRTRTHTHTAQSERGRCTNRRLDGDVQHRSVRGPVLGVLQRPDLEAFRLDPEFKFGVDVVAAFLVQEHPVAVLLVPLEQGLEDFVVFTPGHGLGLAGVPVRPQAPVLKFTEHLRPSARRLGRRNPAAGTPAPRLVLVLVVVGGAGGGGSHRVRHTVGFPRCHDKTSYTLFQQQTVPSNTHFVVR